MILTPVEQMVIECNQKGLAVRCDRLSFVVDNDGFSLYQIWLGKQDLGLWTRTGVENILWQLANPTNPISWFEKFGINVEAIGHPLLRQKVNLQPSVLRNCNVTVISSGSVYTTAIPSQSKKMALKSKQQEAPQTQDTVAAEQLSLF